MMLFLRFLSASFTMLSATLASPLPPRAAPNDPDQTLMSKLMTSVTEVQRVKALLADNPNAFVFDFAANQNKTGAGGRTVSAKRDTFPALIGTGIAASMGFLGPCGMNTAHTHPRGSEFVVVVAGTIQSGFVLENGLTDQVSTTLPKYSLTVYPQGSIHYQFNPACEDAVFVAGFNHEDPGTSQIAQNFFALDPDIVNATLGFPSSIDGKDMAKSRALIPKSVALGVDDCLRKCNITAGQS